MDLLPASASSISPSSKRTPSQLVLQGDAEGPLAAAGQVGAVNELLGAGSNVDAANEKGQTSLYVHPPRLVGGVD